MTQQVIDIGSAPDDSTGDPLRLSFDKTNENFTELYAKGATEGLWNYNKTSTDTSTAPVSGRFKTNSGDYRGATQIAINAITIQGIDRTSTLRTLLVGDLIQCQDSINTAAWCRYSLQSLPVDHGTWFQLNVTFQADGGVASGDNQEIVFVFTASSGAAAGGNVSNSGTPTVGQYAKWVTATTIQGVAPATVLSDIGAAQLASPTFTGDPKAPTPATADNDTSIATTAFVAAAIAAIPAGNPTVSAPQGRLTLQTTTPVMITTQAAKTTLYFTPYLGAMLPLYNGTSFAMRSFSELSVLTTDTTKSPAAIGASKVNDWYIWDDGGVLRLGHGPDWTDDLNRSAGTALVTVNGIKLNNATITNGPAAQRGTWVGTTRSNASSQFDWILGGAGAGGIAIFLGVWNAYNRVEVYGESGDTNNWSISPGNRMMDGSAALRASAVFGAAEDAATVLVVGMSNMGAGAVAFAAVLNSTTATPTGLRGITYGTASGHTAQSAMGGGAVLGFNYWQAMEWAGAAGSSNPLSVGMAGLAFQARM